LALRGGVSPRILGLRKSLLHRNADDRLGKRLYPVGATGRLIRDGHHGCALRARPMEQLLRLPKKLSKLPIVGRLAQDVFDLGIKRWQLGATVLCIPIEICHPQEQRSPKPLRHQHQPHMHTRPHRHHVHRRSIVPKHGQIKRHR